MGRKSNLEKKREILIAILKTKEKALKRSVYLNYLDDIMFYLPTVNKLDKLQDKLQLIPSTGNKIKKSDINKLIKNDKNMKTEIFSIMNAGDSYSEGQTQNRLYKKEARTLMNAGEVYSNIPKFIRTSKTHDKYKKRQHNKLDFYFREYKYDDVDSLNTYDDGVMIPHIANIRHLIANKLMNLISNVNKKLQLHTYITIKYSVENRLEGDIYTRFFNSSQRSISSNYLTTEFINIIITEFLKDLELAHYGSGLVFDGIKSLKIKVNLEKSVYGRSYIPLPTIIKTKQACVNPINDDDKCFKWSLLIAKHYYDIKDHDRNKAKRYLKYWEEIIEPENFHYPVRLIDIEKFEELNNMKINVLELNDKNEIYPIYTTEKRNTNVVTLMLIHEGEKSHYVWVKDVKRLMNSKTCHYKKHICEQCLTASYDCQRKLDQHYDLCMKHDSCKVEMPRSEDYTDDKGILRKANNIMKFKNFGNDFKHPFHIVADFESTLEKFEESNKTKSTQRYQKHIPNSYGLKYNCIHNEYSENVKIYNDSDPEKVRESFILELERLALKSYELTQLNKENIIMSDEQTIKHNKNKKCEKCKCEYTKKNNKVRHHDHINGKFISSVCYDCNIQMQYKTFLPVYIHNLKGYDSHLFISSLFKYGFKAEKSNHISCIPNNEERYISFSKVIKVGEYQDEEGKTRNITYEIRFLDSIAFMNESIESLSNNLSYHFHNNQKLMREFTNDEINNIKNIQNFKRLKVLFPNEKINSDFIDGLLDGYKKGFKTVDQLRNVFKNTSSYFTNDEQFVMMTQKGVYPYDWVDNFNKMSNNTLPDINEFYSKLNNSECSEEDYKTALTVWEKFQCNSFLDYHNIYLVSDVLLLTDIWENFREVCFKMYNLDCEYYYTAPGLSFDAMLKYTNQKLELLTDLDQYLFVEEGIRGGVSQISTRHAIANNKYMSTYEKSKDDSYIVYLDANNLYGAGMSTYLPTDSFKWNLEQWDTTKIMNLGDKDKKGFLFEVDLHIPEEKHDYYNDYPLCPENISIKKEYLNEWQQQNYKESPVKKLCLTLIDKKKYIINYRYLKLVLSLGYELKQVHRVLEYNQSDFLKKYIDLNTDARKTAKNDFEKNFYKLMNNSVYGKTMENVRNRIDFRLIQTGEEALRIKNMKRWTRFDEHLVGLHIQKQKVILNKPIYLGQNILDDSKELMSNFHYNFMAKKVEPQNLKLLFTDTDSLCYHIKNQDIFEIMKNNKSEFDLSNYPKNHELYDSTNSKVIGKMKNESPSQITEFVGLRSKLYNYKVDNDDDNHVRAKGIKRSVASTLSIDDYRKTLETRKNKSIIQNTNCNKRS
jgi:hypothetical protein